MTETVSEHLLSQIDAATLLDAAPDALIVVDVDGRICAANAMAPAMFDLESASLVGLSVEELLPAPIRSKHAQLRKGYSMDPTPRTMGIGLELTAQRDDGTVFPVEISLSPVTIDDTDYVIAAIRDVSEAHAVRGELHRVQQDAALAEDRQRMARDLHDTVIQEIFAVGLSLQSLAGHVDEPAASRVSQAIDDLDRVIRDIRTAIFGLTSHQDWGRGVRGELLRAAADARRALGFEPSIAFKGSVDDISRDIAEHLVPTLRESLSNVAKHAGAQRCDVTVSVTDGHLELTVIDDGVGPPQTLQPGAPDEPAAGQGLKNLTERAAHLGGRCDFRSASIAGSLLQWTVPVNGP